MTDLLGGHPYLMRRAIYLVASGRSTMDELMRTSSKEESPFGDHLRYHFFRLHEREQLVAAMQSVLQHHRLDDEGLYWRLRGAGLVRREGNNVMPRCKLYADYFRARLNA